MWQVGEPYKVILWYRYCPISDVATLIETLTIKCKSLHLLGRILLSIEGMNGTLAGSCEDIDHFINYLSDDLNFHHIDWKFHIEYQHCDYLPFLQLSIREVQEIISCGLQRQFINNFIQYDSMSYGGIEGSGIHLSPEEFHHMIEKEKPENCLILDIRNEFEYDIGHFNNAIGIGTFTYAETFKVLDEVLADEMAKAAAGVKRVQHTDDNANSIEKSDTSIVANDGKTIDECAVEEKSINEKSTNDKKILMYCTGGIRCEKASAYLRAKGLDNVYQLQGGIHRYLEHYPDGGKFLGKNFVFDSRVAVSGEHAAGSNPDQQQHQLDGSYSLGGSSVVVGKCIDCKASHDTYSGFIVCTVCRMPVLVCPNCVENNPYPGEYYCSRHRDLKNVYFTVLERFTPYELQEQKKTLEMLLHKCLLLSERERIKSNRMKDENAMQSKGANEIEDTQELITHSKRRRQTLRKQIKKIEDRLAVLEAEGEEVIRTDSTVNPKVKDGWGFWRT